MKPEKKHFRRELTSAFLEAASKKKTHSLLGALLKIAEKIRSEILLPASQALDSIEIERKDTGDGRGADAKTLTIKTDNECEKAAEEGLRKAFPDAVILGEEKFSAADDAEKFRLMQEAVTSDRLVFLVDALDATRDFRGGGDGYAVMITALQHNKVKAAIAYRCTDHADPDAFGHTLTVAEDDRVRLDGRAMRNLSERGFPAAPEKIRGYAGFEFIAAMQEKSGGKFPDLSGKFDSLSDCWTCSKLYADLLKGDHHFMLVPPPADLFDYPAGIALIEKAGGVVRFLDGMPASFPEIIRRQPYGGDPEAGRSIDNTLIFAVSEEVYAAVQKTIRAALAPQPRPKHPAPPRSE